jgi:hypothetical protein
MGARRKQAYGVAPDQLKQLNRHLGHSRSHFFYRFVKRSLDALCASVRHTDALSCESHRRIFMKAVQRPVGLDFSLQLCGVKMGTHKKAPAQSRGRPEHRVFTSSNPLGAT